MRLAIDLDDVLADSLPALLDFHNHEFGTRLTYEDHRVWDLNEIWGCDREEVTFRLKRFYESPHYRSIQPARQAAQAIRWLARRYPLVVLTAREPFPDLREETIAWIDTHFPGAFEGVFFSHTATGWCTKAEIARELGVTHALEDGPSHALGYIASGIRTILFDRPWNRAIHSDQMDIVHCWSGALRTVYRMNGVSHQKGERHDPPDRRRDRRAAAPGPLYHQS